MSSDIPVMTLLKFTDRRNYRQNIEIQTLEKSDGEFYVLYIKMFPNNAMQLVTVITIL